MIDDLVFDFPQAFPLTLVVIAFLALFCFLRYHRRKVLRDFAQERFLSQNVVFRSRLTQTLKEILVCVVWSLLTLSFMQPKGNPRYEEISSEQPEEEKVLSEELVEGSEEASTVMGRRKAHDVIFLLDASASMSVADTRTGKSRLEYGKEIVDEVTGLLDGQNVVLYAFTSEVSKIVPLTVDYLYSRLLLRQIRINEGDVAGTDLIEALDRIREENFHPGAKKLRTCVLLTDGGDTHLETMVGQEREEELEAILSRLGDAESLHLRVFTVGLGTKEGLEIPGIQFEGQPVISSLDGELLMKLSERGRGQYYFANDYSSLGIAEDIVQHMLVDEPLFEEEEIEQIAGKIQRTLEKASRAEPLYDYYFQFPLGLALLFLAGEMLLPRVRQPRKNRKGGKES